jgi:hydrogenase nickel incorporation protein HypA/HybF
MHEYSIAESLVKLIAEHAGHSSRRKVKSAKVLVGKMTSVVPASLQFYFEMLPKPATMRNTTLDFEEIPLVVRCENCGTKWESDLPVFVCAKCGSTKVDVLSGRELLLQSIEVED